MKKIPNWLIWSIVIVAFAGFLDATYLTVAHFSGSELNCSILEGCNEVTASEYSKIFGIPLALMGSLYYITILILTLLHYDTGNKNVISLVPILTTIGFIFTLYLVYLQLFVINAICVYCMFSALTSTVLFVLGLFILKYRKRLK
ncbi:hypothetical protein GF366_00175 [Candidatus Peregrinibacteria bacterium]|nr:hypothetical protein [Candidatus Peregrinibacteria bacterium]